MAKTKYKKYETREEQQAAAVYQSELAGREKSKTVRELGEIPRCSNAELRESMRYDLIKFARECYPHIVTAEFGKPHLDLLHALQSAVLNGESACLALPRGYGKSSLALIAATWAILYAHRRYIVLIGASAAAGQRLIRNIRSELLYNPILGDPNVTPDSENDNMENGGLFPEVTFPIRKIGNLNARAAGQIYHGEPTRTTSSKDRIILPTISGSPCSGLVIESTGLNGEIRGKNHTTSAGSLRPDLVLVDDPQTDKSARSATQVENRYNLISGCLSGLSAVDRPIAMVASVTVVEDGDLACRLLTAPHWRSVKYGVVNKLPTEEQLELWSDYNNLRVKLIADGLNDKEIQKELNEFFLSHQDEMTGEMKPTWNAFQNPGDISPLQKIMQLYYEDFGAFVRERMNDPQLAQTLEQSKLTVEGLEGKINNYKRGTVPIDVEAITCGCDSQTIGIYFCIVGHATDGTCYILDYGKLPKGRKNLPGLYGDKPLEECVYLGYTDLLKVLLNRRFTRVDGLELPIGKILCDASHGATSARVQQAIIDCQDPRIQPVFGRASTPDTQLFTKKKPGELAGQGWRMPPVRSVKDANGNRLINPRHVLLDVNSWKSTLRSKLLARQGTAGNMSVFCDAPANHREFFLHLTSERANLLTGKYGTIDVWKLLPNRQNHYWDVLNYATAAGSMVTFTGGSPSRNPFVNSQFDRGRVKLSEIQRKRKY